MKTIKCAWCGQILPLTKNGQRPKQHRNGAQVCPGSSQPLAVHQNLQKLKEQR